MAFKTLQKINIKGKRVLVRVDFNVPIDEDMRITDDSRIRQSVPTIKYILESGATAVLMSHMGRPDGKRVDSLSLTPCARKLSELIDTPVQMAPDCIGDDVQRMVGKLGPGEVILLENLRFHEGEEDPDNHPKFVDELARLGDIFVMDAFGAAHRRHASTVILTERFDVAAAGFLVEKEVLILGNLLTQAKEPFLAIIGGSKIRSKIGVLEALLNKIDVLMIGGAMAFTFLKVQGFDVGNSLIDEEHMDTAKQLIKRCKSKGIRLFLPVDVLAADQLSEEAKVTEVSCAEGIPEGMTGVDIGSETAKQWREVIKQMQTIFWNGPPGIFEIEKFQTGTKKIAEALADTKAITIVGGGDSAAAVSHFKLQAKMTHISTGGGATLEFIEKGTLPAIEALSEKV